MRFFKRKTFSFSYSCQCSPARSLPCPDTPQCAIPRLCGSASFSSHTELGRTPVLWGLQTPGDCTTIQWSVYPQWRSLLYNSSTHLRKCRLQSSVLTLSFTPNQVKVSSWRETTDDVLVEMFVLSSHHPPKTADQVVFQVLGKKQTNFICSGFGKAPSPTPRYRANCD